MVASLVAGFRLSIEIYWTVNAAKSAIFSSYFSELSLANNIEIDKSQIKLS